MNKTGFRKASSSGWGPFCICVALALLGIGWNWAQVSPRYFTYVGALSDHSVLLAWGTADGTGNTIGRDSRSHGPAVIEVAGRRLPESRRNWIEVDGLAPDTEYPYTVSVSGKLVGGSRFRTWPSHAKKLVFFVIGDYGNGSVAQKRVASAMEDEFTRRVNSDNPVRFVLTTGDNIYSSFNVRLYFIRSGAIDSDWKEKFFLPYEPLLKRVPFYATLGNHDGNETEVQADLGTYLDNFFFPEPGPRRYYRFTYGELAEFYALDSTDNTETGPRRPQYLAGGEQDRWLRIQMEKPSSAPWRIAYFHHAPFTAGPFHPPSRVRLKSLLDSLQRGGAQVVFSGHEHNFQYSTVGPETGGILYVVSGAGGELRNGDVRAQMGIARIAGWSPQTHFLVVEVDGREMRITPRSASPIRVVDASGRTVRMPIVVQIKE
jgi:hypothetical protein